MKVLSGKMLIERYGIEHFMEASTFGALTDTAIRYLLEKETVLELEKDDRLFTDGDLVNSFYIILKGKVTLFKPGKERNTHTMEFTFGEEVGFVAMIALFDRAATALAADDSIVLEVSSALFHELHNTLPAEFGVLLLNLAREMARRIRKTDELHTAEHK